MSKQFSVNTETVSVSDYEFSGDQAAKVERNAIVRVFRFRDTGYEPVYLGGTTYSHSVIGLREKAN